MSFTIMPIASTALSGTLCASAAGEWKFVSKASLSTDPYEGEVRLDQADISFPKQAEAEEAARVLMAHAFESITRGEITNVGGWRFGQHNGRLFRSWGPLVEKVHPLLYPLLRGYNIPVQAAQAAHALRNPDKGSDRPDYVQIHGPVRRYSDPTIDSSLHLMSIAWYIGDKRGLFSRDHVVRVSVESPPLNEAKADSPFLTFLNRLKERVAG